MVFSESPSVLQPKASPLQSCKEAVVRHVWLHRWALVLMGQAMPMIQPILLFLLLVAFLTPVQPGTAPVLPAQSGLLPTLLAFVQANTAWLLWGFSLLLLAVAFIAGWWQMALRVCLGLALRLKQQGAWPQPIYAWSTLPHPAPTSGSTASLSPEKPAANLLEEVKTLADPLSPFALLGQFLPGIGQHFGLALSGYGLGFIGFLLIMILATLGIQASGGFPPMATNLLQQVVHASQTLPAPQAQTWFDTHFIAELKSLPKPVLHQLQVVDAWLLGALMVGSVLASMGLWWGALGAIWQRLGWQAWGRSMALCWQDWPNWLGFWLMQATFWLLLEALLSVGNTMLMSILANVLFLMMLVYSTLWAFLYVLLQTGAPQLQGVQAVKPAQSKPTSSFSIEV